MAKIGKTPEVAVAASYEDAERIARAHNKAIQEERAACAEMAASDRPAVIDDVRRREMNETGYLMPTDTGFRISRREAADAVAINAGKYISAWPARGYVDFTSEDQSYPALNGEWVRAAAEA